MSDKESTKPQLAEALEVIMDTQTETSMDSPPSVIEANELDNAIECLLFCASEPLSVKQLKHFIGNDVSVSEVRKSVERLKAKYDQPIFGLKLEPFEHGFQFRTKSQYNKFLQNFLKHRPWRISPPAMEVLSIIAYRQPIHRAAIDEIRGTDSSHLLYTLMDKGLVEMTGKAESLPGKPIQYGTTPRFLEVFSLSSLQNLPTPKDVEQELDPTR